MVKLPPDFREFLDLLNEERVNYLVVGGYAVCLYGHPRYTGDIDLWVERSPGNASRLVTAIKRFGFDTPELKEESFLIENYIAQMGIEPLRIELFPHIPGVAFAEAYQHRNIIDCDGTLVSFISIPFLRQAKSATGRTKDLADLENLPESES